MRGKGSDYERGGLVYHCLHFPTPIYSVVVERRRESVGADRRIADLEGLS